MSTPTRKRLSPDDLRAELKRQPLIGLTVAARVLGMAPPNVSRLRKEGRMPEGVPVEGSAQVYFRAEVEELGKRLREARERRGDGSAA